MAGDAKIKIVLHRVDFSKAGQKAAAGKVHFEASVNDGGTTTTFGNKDQHFRPRKNASPPLNWSQEIEIKGKKSIEFRFKCVDHADPKGPSLGNIVYTLKEPWTQHERKETTIPNGNFTLVWTVFLSVGGKFKLHDPNTVFTARQHDGSVDWTTVAGAKQTLRMEVCPVSPLPPDSTMPKRPTFAVGTPPPKENHKTAPAVSKTSPINVFPNPAVIPVLAADEATEKTAARIEYTYYRTDRAGLTFTDHDKRLEWRKVSGAGDVKFLPFSGKPKSTADKGLKVLVYGVTEGEVVLGVHYEGKLLARYRALVYSIKRLPCRFNILYGKPTGTLTAAKLTPASKPEHIADHMKIANLFFRMIGVELITDPNLEPATGSKAVKTAEPGIFKQQVKPKYTRNAKTSDLEKGLTFNYTKDAMNFTYVYSSKDGDKGAAQMWPDSKAGKRGAATIDDSGAPSSSWILPSGVAPDKAAAKVSMKIISGYRLSGHPKLNGMILTNALGADPGGADALSYGNVIAHEVGHMFNLGHRVEEIEDTTLKAKWNAGTLKPEPGGQIPSLTGDKLGGASGMFDDGLWHPPRQNVMHWVEEADIAQDFDILQALAVRQSPLLDLHVAPLSKKEPEKKKKYAEYTIKKGDWLSKIAPKYSMTWKQLYDYDGETGTPNSKRLKSGDPDLIYPGEVILVPA